VRVLFNTPACQPGIGELMQRDIRDEASWLGARHLQHPQRAWDYPLPSPGKVVFREVMVTFGTLSTACRAVI
jgi:hypothetical protein